MAYQKWTKEEKEEYIKNRNLDLRPLYISSDLPIKDPEKRMKYLFEKVKPSMIDEKIFSNLAEKKERHKILLLLEKEMLRNY